MARYKNVSMAAADRPAVKYWWNVVQNYDENVEDSDFSDLVFSNFEQSEEAEILNSVFSKRELNPLGNAGEKLDSVLQMPAGCLLQKIWNAKPLQKKCRLALKVFHGARK